MIKLVNQLPKNLTVAVSGGVDSMALLDFLKNRHNVTAAFFHHGTENSETAFKFLTDYCLDNNINLLFDFIKKEKPSELSPEEFWRTERYKFLESIPETVVTAHNLDDCVETYIWSSLNGTAKLIPYSRNNILRPTLLSTKSDLKSWCVRKQVPWVEDLSNTDTSYTRNYIRHEMMPHVLKVNPGIYKVVKKKLVKKLSEQINTLNTKES